MNLVKTKALNSLQHSTHLQADGES